MDHKFEDVCNVFEKLHTATDAAKKKTILREFYNNYKSQYSNTSFHPVLRLIMPDADRDRGPYGIKALRFAQIIINIYCIPPQSPQALRLLKYQSMRNRDIVDFADAAVSVLHTRLTENGDMTVGKVNEHLDALARLNKDNSARGVEDQIMKLFQECGSGNQQKWVIRIILKEMKFGLGHDAILNIIHPDASLMYSNTNDLAKVCEVLGDASARLHEMEISLYSCVRPMLSKRCDAQPFLKIKEPCNFIVEKKFDGERFQIHMKDGLFKYFSRNGFDYTKTYGKSLSEGFYTPSLAGVFKRKIKSVILDGEMMGYNKRTKEFGSKGMAFDVKNLKENNVHQPCFCVFDILLLDDVVLTNERLEKRVELLQQIISPKEGVFVLSETMRAHCKQDILDALNMAFDRKEEGIVFKDPDSVYQPNNRNAGWWKMKLEYFEGVMNDLDVLILGGLYGNGRLRKQISCFVVGIIEENENESSNEQPEKKFLSFAKVSSGLSDNELKYLDEKIGKFWNFGDHQSANEYGIKFGKAGMTAWIKPENSCVLTVRATELIKSTSSEFATDYTLRFPRILKIRDDKNYYECMTTSELKEMVGGHNVIIQKLNNRHLYMEDFENIESGLSAKKRKRYEAPQLLPVEEKSKILEGYEFCVLSGSPDWDKEDIKTAIRENGGTVVLTERRDTFCIIAERNHPRIEFLMNTNAETDIVKPAWLKDVLNRGVFYMYKLQDAVYLNRRSQCRISRLCDRYKDYYCEDATESSILDVFEEVEKLGDYINPTAREIESLGIPQLYGVFTNYVAYFDKYEIVNDFESNIIYKCLLDQMTFQCYGGTVSASLTGEVGIIIIKDEGRRDAVSSMIDPHVIVVTRDFIHKMANTC